MRSFERMKKRVGYFGDSLSADQWTRMREDKLRSLKKALRYSYQAAIVQKYNVSADSEQKQLITIATKLEKIATLTDEERASLWTQLSAIEQTYPNLKQYDRYSQEYLKLLRDIIAEISQTQPYFRCLINHDKLKVDYEDKVLSIPFEENTVSIDPVKDNLDLVETGFHNGTVFKWVHGNKQEWTPDTYWIVYMQYSEETAYFRAEIRKADEEIEIITIDDEGTESTVRYRGWMTGPNETTALWNVKKGVVWNDMNYTKLLYITKDEDTLAFFQRFDRIIINGKPWEVQAYNESYSTNKNGDTESGIIRVALKETYTNTPQFVREKIQELDQNDARAAEYDAQHTQARIDGPATAAPYDILTYTAKNMDEDSTWTLSDSTLAKIISTSQDGKTIKISILADSSVKEGFNLSYGDLSINIPIVSL